MKSHGREADKFIKKQGLIIRYFDRLNNRLIVIINDSLMIYIIL